MAYPIPNEIAYEEKFAFNMTAKQLCYAVVFGIGTLQAYSISGPALGTPFSFLPPVLMATVGLGFMYLRLEDKVKDLSAYYSGARNGGYYDKKVRNFIEVDEIREDALFLRNGELRSVLRVNPLNLSMYDEGRKKAVIDGFASFLQQLDHPIQLHARTVNVDLSEYFDKEERKMSKELLLLYRDFRQFEENLIRENAVRNRLFYVIVPYSGKGDNQLNKLWERTRIVMDGLSEAGLSAERLNSEELVSFVSSYFEDRLAIGGDYIGHGELLKEFYRGKDMEKKLLKELMCPSRIETKPDRITVNETHYRIILGAGYPRAVESGWLDRLIRTRDDYDVTIHIEPVSIEASKVMLHNQIIKEQADYSLATAKGMPDPSLRNKLSDTKKFFNWLDRGEERLFSVGVCLMCKAPTLEKLDYLTAKCKADLNSVSIIPKIPYYRMAQAMQTVIPLGIDKLKRTREFPTSALAATFPFISSTPEIEEDGLLIAHDKSNNNPIIRDFGRLSNLHCMILARSGAGKSYTAKLLISRMMMKGTRIFVIDPSGEYVKICNHFHGQVVRISRDSDTIINPLELFGENFADKRISLVGFFSVILGGMSPAAEGALDKALKETYLKKGISEDVPEEINTQLQPPKMGDLLDVLNSQLDYAKRDRMQDSKRTLQALITKIERYCHGGVYSFVDRYTSIDVKKQFIVFDIKDLPEEVKSVFIYLVLDFITNSTKNDLERKAIVIDEGWSLLNNEKAAEHLLWLAKSARKFNTGLVFITQEVNDLLGNRAGESILSNAATKILLAQDSSAINTLSEVLHLTQRERNLLVTARKGDGLLMLENVVRVPISVKASPEEHKLITTNPEELKKMATEKVQEPQEDEKVKELPPKEIKNYGLFEGDKLVYQLDKLTKPQADYLKASGYEELEISPLGGPTKNHLVRPRYNESVKHAFFVWLAEQEVRKYTDKVQLFESVNSDVVFESPKGTVAIEVETGLHIRSDERMRGRFDKLAGRYDHVIVLVTSGGYRAFYSKYCETITKRELHETINVLFKGDEDAKV